MPASTSNTDENPAAQAEPSTVDTAALAACPKCGALKVTKSRLQGLDSLKMRLVARAPHRCLRCYARFWLPEPWASYPRRVHTWIGLVLLVTLALLVWWLNESQQGSKTGQATPALDSSKMVEQTQEQLDSHSADVNIENQSQASGLSDSIASSALQEAKLQAQQAEIRSEERQARLTEDLADTNDELASLARIDINFALQQWRTAWEQGDINSYLQRYSGNFIPASPLSLEQWQEQRRSRIKPNSGIQVSFSNYEVSLGPNLLTAIVRFDQLYKRGAYEEVNRKELSLSKEAEGWKIVSELQLD